MPLLRCKVIRPEVCRTFHFATRGTSNNEFSEYLTAIRLNDRYVDFSAMDLASQLDPQIYETGFLERSVLLLKAMSVRTTRHVRSVIS
jgi:Fe-S-cluster containining protein